MWPDLSGYTAGGHPCLRPVRGQEPALGALGRTGAAAGRCSASGLMEFPLLENPHSTEIMLAVHPDHRRRGVGNGHRREDGRARRGRRPALAQHHRRRAARRWPRPPSRPFAHKMGFESTLTGNLRQLRLPMDQARRDDLRAVVAGAPERRELPHADVRDAVARPSSSMTSATSCGVMSTDEPAGDGERQAETLGRRAPPRERRAPRGTRRLQARRRRPARAVGAAGRHDRAPVRPTTRRPSRGR